MTTESNQLETTELSPQAQEDLDYVIDEFLSTGGVFKYVHGITDKEMEATYAVAYNLYSAGKYEESLKVFKFLCFYDHMERKYWLGQGAAQQMLGRHEQAVQSYSYAALLDIKDPRPPMHAADCYMSLGNWEAAQSALHCVIEFSGDDPTKKSYRDRAEALLSMMKEKQEKERKEG